MATILALINAHALAHVSRPLEVAKVLRNRGHRIIFGGHGKYLTIAAQDGFDTVELPYVPVGQLVEAVRTQRLDRLYKEEQISEYIDAELELYRRTSPDLVIVDNRPTAVTSAEYARIRTVSIINVHMSQAKAIPFHSLRNVWRLGAHAPFKHLDRLENLVEGYFVDRFVMADLAKIRRRLGLKKRHGFANEEGDLNLYPDLSEFSPVSRLLPNAYYVGPLTWHNSLPPPDAWQRVSKEKQCIYFTVGSEGLEELIESVARFASEETPVIIATGEGTREAGALVPSNVFLEKFVNTETVLPRCRLVVCHGGNGTIYQALSHGVPIVGIATHEEQYYGLKRVNELKLGIGVRAKRLKAEGFRLLADAIEEVLRNEKYKTNVRRLQKLIASNGDSAVKAADVIEAYIAAEFNCAREDNAATPYKSESA